MGRAAPVRLLDLAPGGVCLAAPVTKRAGGLLHHRFTLAACAAIRFSVALCRRVAPPGISPAPRPVEGGLSSMGYDAHCDFLVCLN
jgi:hypothetical protein